MVFSKLPLSDVIFLFCQFYAAIIKFIFIVMNKMFIKYWQTCSLRHRMSNVFKLFTTFMFVCDSDSRFWFFLALNLLPENATYQRRSWFRDGASVTDAAMMWWLIVSWMTGRDAYRVSSGDVSITACSAAWPRPSEAGNSNQGGKAARWTIALGTHASRLAHFLTWLLLTPYAPLEQELFHH